MSDFPKIEVVWRSGPCFEGNGLYEVWSVRNRSVRFFGIMDGDLVTPSIVLSLSKTHLSQSSVERLVEENTCLFDCFSTNY